MSQVRVLVCRDCQTAEKLPWCGEDLHCTHPECTGPLERQLARHRGHNGNLSHIDEAAWESVSGRPFGQMAALSLGAPLTCPECGSKVKGHWTESTGSPSARVVPQDQTCPKGHVFPATWPGWGFEPQVAIVERYKPPEDEGDST